MGFPSYKPPIDFDPSKFRAGFRPSVDPPADRNLHSQANIPGQRSGRFWSEEIRQKKIELLALLVQGMNLKDAAKHLHISYVTCRRYANDPEVLKQLHELSKTMYDAVYGEVIERKVEAHERILEMADEALTTLEDLLQSENDGVRLKAAQDVLDRHGEVPRQTKSSGSVGVQVNFNADMLALAVQGAREIEGTRKVQRLIKADIPPEGNQE